MTEHTLITRLKNSVGLKVFSILVMIILLMIPNSLIQELINERSFRKTTVENEVAASYGMEQIIYPAFIKIPYVRTQLNAENKPYTTDGHLGISANTSSFDVNLTTNTKKRGIYEVVLYDTQIANNATFNWQSFKPNEWKEYAFDFDKAYLVYGIKDANGIADTVTVIANGKPLEVEGNASIQVGNFHWLKTENFTIDVNEPLTIQSNWLIKGTKGLYVEPMGDLVEVQMQSTWPDPSFTGKNLPAHHEITTAGFNANWKVNKFSHTHPQVWQNDVTALGSSSFFGVNLIQPINEYGKNFRTSKYALLIISLTFGIFFFFEILLKKSIHPIQYTLVGFALTVFYLLLLSITEHLGFDVAYLISSVATILLIVVYTHFILKRIGASILLLALLSSLFGYVFIILQMQDFALLAGAIALFVVLAAVMLLSRNVDWYSIGKSK